MFKTILVENKSWWVPENEGYRLAVQISKPEDYYPAIARKMEALIKKEGLEQATWVARDFMEFDQAPMGDWEPQTPEELRQMVMGNCNLGERERMGHPAMANPEPDEARARDTVLSQSELTWGEFLT